VVKLILTSLLRGVVYLHDLGIIHRDIKLENVVVSADLNAKIVDFGTAKPVVLEDFYSK
jgi:serine/threonine protein kinase